MILVVKLLQTIIKHKTNSWPRQLFVCMAVISFSAFITACVEKETMVRISGPIMGTQYKLTLVCESDRDEKAWQAEVLPVMETVNQSMSTYLTDSELSKFNQSESTDFQEASPALIDVFSAAQRVSHETRGAFDVTVMPLVDLWGFGPNQQRSLEKQKIPSDAELLAVKQQIGFDKLEFDGSFTKWRKKSAKVSVDFSAIAKGYAVDKVSNHLMELGCVNHLVEIGGEIRAEGVNAKGNPWRLAVEKPDSPTGFQVVIDLSGGGVASSGDYRNFYVEEGKRYSHTVDPRTLKPIDHNLAAVTVIDPITARADALATAFMVMGEEGLEFAENNRIPAFFIFRLPTLSSENEPQFQVLYSQAFEEYIVNK